MSTVTLIGPDGAGKTTLATRLAASDELRIRYLYMGVDIDASNAVLPTSRLVRWARARRGRNGSGRGGRATGAAGAARSDAPAAAATTGPSRPPGGAVEALRPADATSRADARTGRPPIARSVRAAARLGNWLAEEWYRQAISWMYQRRGYIVLYDRHFVFDFAPEISEDPALDKRIHRWLLAHAYPRPDLVIFLDAPGDVLHARKGESTPAELERRRQAFLRQGARMPNFVRVDATRDLESVFAEVTRLVRSVDGPAGRRAMSDGAPGATNATNGADPAAPGPLRTRGGR